STTTTLGATTTTTPAASTTTTSTPGGGTTTTTLASLCGNGFRDPGEQCDPSTGAAGCPTGTVCGPVTTPNACRCVPPGGEITEICGNCIDDDGNGLTDFEDPACCPTGRGFSLTLRRGRIRSAGGNLSKLRLKTILAQHGLEGINPLKEDVFLQIRPEGGADVFCARIPAGKWTKGKRTFKFKDRKHTVASAQGLDVVKIKVKAKKGVRLRTRARQAKLKTPSQGRLQVTVGFHDGTAGDAQNRCTSTVAQFRTGRKGRLKAP